jgi:hypothetical protein
MVTAAAAHAAVTTAHSPSSATHTAGSATDAVTAAPGTGVVTAMVLDRARGISVRCLIGASGHPLVTEIHWCVGHRFGRHGAQQAKRKTNMHPHIL